jgi:hypothetical protein
VAVVGQVTLWTLLVEVARLSGLAEGEVVVALEAACKARLLVEMGEDGYAFANDLTCEALAGALSAARRKALQRQIAAAQGYSQGEAQSRSRSRNSAGAVRRQSGALTDGQYRVGGRTGRTDDGDLRMA